MLKCLMVPAVLFACASMALGQSDVTKAKDKKRETPPRTIQAPSKDVQKRTSGRSAALQAGDRAPSLSVEKWVKGDPVPSFAKGKVYVVEFWATWCGPCVKNIPHLTELQEKHKDVTIIGMAASERREAKGGSDQRLSNLERYVKSKGKQMAYTVAYEGDGETYRKWMTAAGKNGIPCAFIVDGEGKIAWIGNPGSAAFEAEIEKATAKAKSGDTKGKTTDAVKPAKDEVKKETVKKEPTRK